MADATSTAVLRDLRLRNFRNFQELEVAFPSAGVAIIGDNGSGKTNLLEAICYLEIFRSFRGAPDEQLVRFDAEGFHVRGHALRGAEETIAAGFETRGKRKKVTINGNEPERIGDALGQIGAVIFSPSDVEIIRGSPAERRRYLDIVLSLNYPGYLRALQHFKQVLRHRNAILRSGRGMDAISAFDDGLIHWGAQVMATRADWVDAWGERFAEHYSTIAGGVRGVVHYSPGLGRESATVVQSGADSLRLDRIREAFDVELSRVRSREQDRRMTLVGPHRDDLLFVMHGQSGDVDLRDFGSGGQVRTASIALRFIEAETARVRRGLNPLILLDDVFAELDHPRAARILELIEDQRPGQIVLTAPKESDVVIRSETLARWRIAAGRIDSRD